MKRCPKCNRDFPDEANFCPTDAAVLVQAQDEAPEPRRRLDTGGNLLLDGRFAVGELVAGSRTGAVHRAVDKEGTIAIVKFVAREVFPSALHLQQGERALRQLEGLEHGGIAKVLGFGRHEEQLWIASEQVDGRPLSEYIAERGKLNAVESVALLNQIGEALEAAGARGVSHADLAPKNILVAEGSAKLINFTIPVPQDSKVQGIAEYVSPEQLEGRSPDQTCNIYSLGALAFAMLTGAPPYQGSVDEVRAGHRSGEPPSLSGVVPDAMAAVLIRALDKSSAKRYLTIRQFLDALGQAAAGGDEAPSASATGKGKGKSKAAMNQTLMGVSPAEMEKLRASAPAPSPKAEPVPSAGSTMPGGMPAQVSPSSAPAPAPAVAQEDPGSTAPLGKPAVAPEPATAAPEPAVAPVAAPEPAAAAPEPAVAPAPEPAPEPAVAVAPVAAAPVAAAAPEPAAPAPAAPKPAQSQGSAASGKKSGGQPKVQPSSKSKKGKFRETMWFKKGELDEEAAKAAAQARPEDQVSAKADELEMDQRYEDDGTITQQDKQRLSLRTGGTMMMEAMPEQRSAGSDVSEQELLSEMKAGRNKIIIAGVAIVIVLGVAIALLAS